MGTTLPCPRILLGPGPSGVSARVLDALGRSPIGYLDPELFTLLDALRSDLRTVLGTKNEFTIPLTGTGMAGMECSLVNLIEPGDNVVICVNGFFGGRMAEISRRLGGNVTVVSADWGHTIDPQRLIDAIKNLPSVKLIGCVHAETSTGVCQPLRPIADIARTNGALFLVDAVTSVGGIPVNMDDCDVDVCYSATQKCIGGPPGLSPVSVSEAAWSASIRRKLPVPNWYYDWQLLRNYFDSPHTYHHTVPVNLLFALREALAEILDEGLQERYLRHREVSAELLTGLSARGINAFTGPEHRLPTLNAVLVPDKVSDEVNVRKRLLHEYGLEIGGGLGELKGKVWRVGTMGSSATKRNVALLLTALDDVMS